MGDPKIVFLFVCTRAATMARALEYMNREMG